MDVLNADERGATPVIGVVLVVAIVIVLAAVISFYVLDVGQKPSPAPSATFGFDYDSTGQLTITHEGGKTIDGTNTLELRVQYTDASGTDQTETWSLPVESEDSYTLSNPPKSGTEVRVVWTDPEGDTTQFLATDRVP